jgi:hypothetical protein
MNAKERKTELENERLKRATQEYRLEMQGKRLTLSKTGYKRCTKSYPVRGIVTEFSRRARARRLRRIAEVNWSYAGESSFITLTYPDEVSDHTMQQRKVHRYLFNRWVCKVVGRPLACFWRVEWLPRLSGNFIGELRPHMHMLYLNTPKICWLAAMKRWMQIISVRRFTQVCIRPLEIAEAVSVYVAKYCSKEASNLLLDNVPKRNRCGRHAGELRKALIPLHEREVVQRVNQAIVMHLRGRACETLWWYDPRFDEGFTILGDDALELIREIHRNYLDREAGID